MGTTTDLSWQYSNLESGQSYVAAVSAQYDEGESELITCEFTFMLNPPTDVQVNNETWILSWNSPKDDFNGTYNLYLDGVLMVESINDTIFQLETEDFVVWQQYTTGISAVYDQGESEIVAIEFVYVIPVDVDNNVVTKTTLIGNYPNPFNPFTTISFSLKEAGSVRLDIYNIKGQLVKTLVDSDLDAANHQVIWDGKGDNNRTVSSGIYFYKLKADGYEKVKKMILMK